MAGMSNTLIDKMLNASLPTGAAGIPGTWTAYNASAMKLRLNSNSASKSTMGSEITGSGYTAGGAPFTAASTASSGGSGVSCPATTALSWTNGGTSWSIVSFDLVDNAGARAWFGDFNGQPIVVANGNTFQIAVGGITINAT